jgi:outer membrane receptor protein involved in Fe transport
MYRIFREENDTPFEYFDFRGNPLPEPVAGQADKSVYESWSVFGDTSYRFGWLTVGAGARYFQEHQEHSDFIALTHQDAQFHSADPRVYAQLKLASNANAYASAAKGFRSGGFNYYPGQPPFGPEDVWTYELGAKGVLPDDRVSFDAAIYLSNYSQYQLYAAENIAQSLTFNAGAVRIKGVEASLTWNPWDHWRLEGRGNYVNARFTEVNSVTPAVEAAGDPLDEVPRYQFTVSGEHDFSWFGKQDVIRVDYNQTSSMAYRSHNIGPWFYASSPVIQMLNLHMSAMLTDNLKVGVSVQNLLNEQGFLSPYWYLAQGVRPRPRTFGVNFSTTFGGE